MQNIKLEFVGARPHFIRTASGSKISFLLGAGVHLWAETVWLGSSGKIPQHVRVPKQDCESLHVLLTGQHLNNG